MSAPLLRALDLEHPNIVRHPSCVPPLDASDDVRAFLVVGEGSYRGLEYGVGDVLVCRGEARHGAGTVLVARHGRPRLGSVVGQRLLGDAGEACHPGRWRPVGRLWAVYRRAGPPGGGWRLQRLCEASGEPVAAATESLCATTVGRVVIRSAAPSSTRRQLMLFAA